MIIKYVIETYIEENGRIVIVTRATEKENNCEVTGVYNDYRSGLTIRKIN